MRLTPHKARLYLLLGFFLLALPSINSFYKGTTGKLLVAAGAMSNPVFSRSVIYMKQHDLFGAVGFILNRQSGRPPLAGNIPVYMGGPVDTDVVNYLDVSGRRIAYAGYAGWAPIQLNNEIWSGYWYVIDADPEILHAPPDQMWPRAIQKIIARDGAWNDDVL